ncbi:membrane alanyl aminopeptidase [Scaptodrosophila lebanonensis]|uniref:Aminopeptidase n=1 Tax=Drosophila lebanonensis TaxID=7225 RepID=A0A6J2T612_DROLE|nr:membrane alanyl aminopeptidase [Scaptodrosophila lebanonensis]
MYGIRLLVVLTACLSIVLGDTRVLDQPVPFADENYRLPININPVNYNITLRPYLLESDGDRRFQFDGEVYIEVKPTETTGTISLHSKSLTYTKCEYWTKTTGTPTPQNITITAPNNVTDIWAIPLSSQLTAANSYIFHFVYVGLMEDDMHGFYRSYYTDDNNQTKWLGSTQFQTNHARRAFPSFDEPQFKATFDVTLIRHRSYNAVSNTRRISSSSANGEYYTDVFATTPTMSTYLLAFIISEFTTRTDGVFGVLSRPEFYGQTQYSFTVGPQILAKLGEYLNLSYYDLGNDKMDMAAIPDFSAGAMENWGLLTYRERSLLVDESATTLASRQSIAAVVAHEQAHMWFGDLVTCQWWSYTWLNEGFARYFQYFGTAFVETEWDLDKQFVVDQIQSVMSMDSTNATNPLSDEDTNTPADLSRMFNSISYNKGASFIRMIEHTMGSDNFQKSLQKYLADNQYKPAYPKLLLDAWQLYWPENRFNSSSEDIFNSFTTQVGYPLINVDLAQDGRSVKFSQQRFLLKDKDISNSNLAYYVPITYTTNVEKNFNDTSAKFILKPSETKEETLSQNASWIIANIQETGYYRVNYTESNWNGIRKALYESSWGGISELNRAQVVDDLFNLARSSGITYDLALGVLEYLETETNYIPWTSAFNGYNFLAIRLGTDTAHFGNYIQHLTYKVYNQLGFYELNTDRALDIYLRTKVLSWACRYGSSDCIYQAKNYFKYLDSVPKNIRSVVYCVGLREGGTSEFESLYNKFKKETVATEETLLQNSFGCVKQQALIERVFKLVISDEIRRQDKSSVLSTLYTENNENVSPVFKLVTEQHEELAEAMGSYSAVATVISNLAARFTEESQKKDLEDFTTNNKHKFGSSATTLETAVKTVEENLVWANEKLGTFRTYLASRNGAATKSAFTALTLVLLALVTLLR